MFEKIKVYDVDGVLLDSRHRHNYNSDGSLDVIDYFNRCRPDILALDNVLPAAEQYRRDCLNPKIYTVICSVRSNEDMHINSIAEKVGLPDLLLLVGEKKPPLAPGHILKLRALTRLFNLRQFQKLPRVFIEDSKKNLDATKHLFNNVVLLTDNRVAQE